MALQMKVTTSQGIACEAAYLRIEQQSWDKGKMYFRIRTYADVEKCVAGYEWINEAIYDITPSLDDNAPNFIKQGYEFLKDLSEYEGYIDV